MKITNFCESAELCDLVGLGNTSKECDKGMTLYGGLYEVSQTVKLSYHYYYRHQTNVHTSHQRRFFTYINYFNFSKDGVLIKPTSQYIEKDKYSSSMCLGKSRFLDNGK